MGIDVNKEKDFMEFFGETAAKVLSPVMKVADVNELKRELFVAGDIPLKKLYDIILNSDYFTIMAQGIGDNWFGNLRNIKSTSNLIYKTGIEQFNDKPNNEINIIDYGCGLGSCGLWFALNGYNVTLADIPHKHFQFLKFLCDKYKVKVNFFDIPCSNDIYLPGKYDYIICNEVLEHVDEPELVLKSLIRSMGDDGIMYLSTFFDDCNGIDTSHLKKNTLRYNYPLVWLDIVSQLGLTVFIPDNKGISKIFKKAR